MEEFLIFVVFVLLFTLGVTNTSTPCENKFIIKKVKITDVEDTYIYDLKCINSKGSNIEFYSTNKHMIGDTITIQ